MSGATSQPSGTSWSLKKIDLTITLGKGTFGQTGKNTVKLSGLRVATTILKAGFPSQDKAEVRVYGVQPTVMNSISTLGIPLAMWRIGNTLTIEAGDDINGMSVVFTGYLNQAYQDFSQSPETALVMVAWGGQDAAILPADPISIAGSADVATMLSGIANRQGWTFENSGVQVTLSNAYYAGTALQQVHDICRDANIEGYPDTGTTPITLAIWPKYSTRGGMIPLINKASGLVGYPTFQSNGMSFRCLLNRNIKLGGQITMASAIGGAAQTVTADQARENALPPGTQTGGPNGNWTVISPLVYNLAAQLPGGPWFTEVHCARVLGPGA